MATLSPNSNLLSDLSKRIFFVFAVSKVTSSPKAEVALTSTELLNVDRPTTFTPLLNVISVLTPVLGVDC